MDCCVIVHPPYFIFKEKSHSSHVVMHFGPHQWPRVKGETRLEKEWKVPLSFPTKKNQNSLKKWTMKGPSVSL